MAQPLAAPYCYFTDNNGAPLAGGLVYTYAAGTTTPQNSYTDSTGGTPNANPVVLDSAGRAAIWLSGNYKIVVKDSLFNTIHTDDNITTASTAITSAVDTAFTFVNGSDATKKLAFDLSGISSATTRAVAWPDKNGTVAMTSDITGGVACYQVTDSTDITLSLVPTQANVGSTKSMVIPTKGFITLAPFFEMITTTTANNVIFGLRIGATNYWPASTTNYYTYSAYNAAAATNDMTSFGVLAGDPASTPSTQRAGALVGMSIEKLSVPTGTQTVQIIAAKGNPAGANACVLKGTVVSTLVNVSLFNCNA